MEAVNHGQNHQQPCVTQYLFIIFHFIFNSLKALKKIFHSFLSETFLLVSMYFLVTDGKFCEISDR